MEGTVEDVRERRLYKPKFVPCSDISAVYLNCQMMLVVNSDLLSHQPNFWMLTILDISDIRMPYPYQKLLG
jgi:hypothetical protein